MTRRVRALLLLWVLGLSVLLWQRHHERTCTQRLALRRGIDEIKELVTEVESWDACVRSAAAFDLQNTGLLGADAIPGLVRLLRDSSDEVRWRAAAALGHIGIATPDVIRSLIAALQDKHNTVRHNAIFSLAELFPPEAARAMASLVTDPAHDLRHLALYDLRFVALPGDREWVCPMLATAILGGEDGWLAAAETSGIIGCIDLIPSVTEVRTRWLTRCPTAVSNGETLKSPPSPLPWAVSEATGRGCESGAITLSILNLTIQRLSIRKTLEQPTE